MTGMQRQQVVRITGTGAAALWIVGFGRTLVCGIRGTRVSADRAINWSVLASVWTVGSLIAASVPNLGAIISRSYVAGVKAAAARDDELAVLRARR